MKTVSADSPVGPPSVPVPFSVLNLTKFNVNYHVYVRLTDHGREIYRKYWRQFSTKESSAPSLTVDETGWSKFQLWELMAIFGPHIFSGGTVPFETTIYFDQSGS